ncbi:DUF983 domain-containing protein [Limobrevibacterium gyesilva]|uniref:DUF983 domain-containing protein n=1 Tax=Limobrevibacterium gyesilva TaxID=2991712 RepID=A0AA42CG53_9PROT|nr:DUF983 domain-containing protein [Limobrevibacterium gyesilva]MCW3475666.1 DUF983 domain-containing protein [Limobrevibacterium gyesilva]
MQTNSIWTGIRRGLARRCPACGQGRLFSGFLKVRQPCEACGTDNTVYPSDDMPPYLTIVVVGHVIVPLFMWVDHAYEPAMWLQFAVWLPLTALMSLLLLPPLKGGVVGLCWATGMTRQDPAR